MNILSHTNTFIWPVVFWESYGGDARLNYSTSCAPPIFGWRHVIVLTNEMRI